MKRVSDEFTNATELKVWMGVPILVNTNGRFFAKIPGYGEKANSNVRVIEKWIAENAPKGQVEVRSAPSSSLSNYPNHDKMVITGFGAQEDCRRSRWEQCPPVFKLRRDGAYYTRGELSTATIVYHPDPALDAEASVLREEYDRVTKGFQDRLKAINARYVRYTPEEIKHELERQSGTRVRS